MPEYIHIAPDVDMPILGLGTWQLQGNQCRTTVRNALATGHRHIDTALMYGNQRHVAEGIADSGVPREEVFVTSKVWRDRLSYDGVREQTDTILDELDTDYVDLLLIHWPNSALPMQETLEALTDIQEKGEARAVGVSNFTRQHLEKTLATHGNIAVNQVEYHPGFQQKELRDFCHSHDVTVTAYSPFGRGQDIQLPVITEIADKHQKSPGQVILNWLMQKGIVAIPRTANPEHLESNFKALEWDLPAEDLAAIDAIEQGDRQLNPPFAEFR